MKASKPIEIRLNTRPLEAWLRANKPRAVKKLADLSGVSASGIEKLRSFERHPTDETINALAGALGVSFQDLVEFVPAKRS